MFDQFLIDFGAILAPFWLHFEPRGVPGDPLEPLCVAPVPQDPPKRDFGVVLGAPLAPHLAACCDQFWALDPFWRLWGDTLAAFLAHLVASRFRRHFWTRKITKNCHFLVWPMWLKRNK